MTSNGDEPDPREVYLCMHCFIHRQAAKGLTDYSEATLLVDEWMIPRRTPTRSAGGDRARGA